MTPAESNKALVRRFYEEIDKGNIGVFDEVIAEDCLDHNPPAFARLGIRARRAETSVPNVSARNAGPSPNRGSDRGRGQGGDAAHVYWEARRRSSWRS